MKQQLPPSVVSSETAGNTVSTQEPAGPGNQALLAELGLPSVEAFEELGHAGLDWLGEALARTAAANEGFGGQGSFLGLVADALELSDDQAKEAEVRRLLETGEFADPGLARVWVEQLADGSFQAHPEWDFVYKPLLEMVGYVDGAATIVKAIDAVRTPDACTRPGDTVRELQLLLDAAVCLLPYTPVLTEFLSTIPTCLGILAQEVDGLAVLFRRRLDERLDTPLSRGAYSGGFELTNYLKGMHRRRAPVPPPGVVEWTIAHADVLRFLTGEAPPVQKNEVLGLDSWSDDDVDLVGLAAFFADHLDVIASYVWGNETREHYWGRNAAGN